jgi:hypothetical protein
VEVLMFEIKRSDNESFIDYCERLIEAKESNQIDIDKSEIWELLFGEKLSSDETRKRIYGVKALASKLKDEGYKSITEDDIIRKIETKQLELQKEKYKVQTLRLDLDRIIRETSRSELLYDEFISTLKQCDKIPLPQFKELQRQSSNKQYLLSFADSHFGKEFESITNEYDLNIVYDRFNKLFNETIEIVEECKINKLTILALGDLIEGMCLRMGQLASLKIGITKQTIQFMRFMVSWLTKLSEYVEIIYYSTPYSNHTQLRPFGSKANEFVSEDMEQIIFAYIHDMLADNPRVEIKECKNKHVVFNIFKYNIIASHGHDIKNPTDFIKDASDKYKIFFDYAFFAHRHSLGIKTVGEGSTNNCDIINIPRIMGSDEYADSLLVGSKAGATLIEFTEQQGKRKTYDIILN